VFRNKPKKDKADKLIVHSATCISILEMVILRLNRGVSITKALEEMENMFGTAFSDGLAKASSSRPLVLEDFSEYDPLHTQMFAMLVESVRCTRGFASNVILDAFILLKNHMILEMYYGERANTYPLGYPTDVKPEDLHNTVMRIIKRALP